MVENELDVISMDGITLAQFCVSPKTVEKNFQFQKEEKVENELGVMSMEGAALAQSFFLGGGAKSADQKVLRIDTYNSLNNR